MNRNGVSSGTCSYFTFGFQDKHLSNPSAWRRPTWLISNRTTALNVIFLLSCCCWSLNKVKCKRTEGRKSLISTNIKLWWWNHEGGSWHDRDGFKVVSIWNVQRRLSVQTDPTSTQVTRVNEELCPHFNDERLFSASIAAFSLHICTEIYWNSWNENSVNFTIYTVFNKS